MLRKIQLDTKQQVDNGTYDKETLQPYLQSKNAYHNDNYKEAQEDYTILKSMNEGLPPEDYNKDELSLGARRMVEILEQIRDEEQ